VPLRSSALYYLSMASALADRAKDQTIILYKSLKGLFGTNFRDSLVFFLLLLYFFFILVLLLVIVREKNKLITVPLLVRLKLYNKVLQNVTLYSMVLKDISIISIILSIIRRRLIHVFNQNITFFEYTYNSNIRFKMRC